MATRVHRGATIRSTPGASTQHGGIVTTRYYRSAAGVRLQSAAVREEVRRNLIFKIRNGDDLFPGIVGFEESVIPQLENALLAGQDVILLGERGQAKSG